MIAYAIKHKPTGGYLLGSKTGRGGSYETYGTPTQTKLPRMFASYRSARAALVAWLQGPWERHYKYEESYFTPMKDPTRIKEDMEVVKLEFTEVPIPCKTCNEFKSSVLHDPVVGHRYIATEAA